MRKFKKGLSIALALALSLGIGGVAQTSESAAATKKVKLSATKITLTVGKTKKLTLKNSKKKAKWSIKSGKKYIKLTKKKKKSVVISAKKKGKATVVAKVGKKKYTCKVTVKAKSTTTTTTKATATPAPTTAPTVTPAPTTAPTTAPDSGKTQETPVPTATPVAATSVVLSSEVIGLASSEDEELDCSTKQLKATVYPLDAVDQSLTWSSSNEGVVSVSQDGTIQAKADEGTATITVSTSNGKKATCKVTIYPAITSFSVSETKSYTVNKTAKNPQPVVNNNKLYSVEPEDSIYAVDFEPAKEGVVSKDEWNQLIGVGTGETDVDIVCGNTKETVSVKVTKDTVAIHDPSIFKDPLDEAYYVVGTQMGEAKSVDLQEFSTSTSGFSLFRNKGNEVKPLFDYVGGNIVADNLWAGDMIYNKEMDKYCIYVCATGEKSISGAAFDKTAIGMLSSDSPTGPYDWEGMIVCADFFSDADIEKTNIREALGMTDSEAIPDRYKNTTGKDTLSGIDPNPYYDDKGNLYLAYGSFTGGATVNILKLNPETGLRDPDYNYKYSAEDNTDPYFGKTVTAVNYGEGPYVLKAPNKNSSTGYYYYLWVSTGALRGTGTYQMSYARSENPDGPFVNVAGKDALSGGRTLVQYHYKFSYMDYAYTSMGGNSALYDEDLGKYFLVYHNKFSDNSANPGTHMVKVHQMFFTEDGWPLYTPYDYHGETMADHYSRAQVVGDYEFIMHKTQTVKAVGNYTYNESTQLSLNEDGTVTGSLSGTWKLEDNKITITAGDITYRGVVLEQFEEDSKPSGQITGGDKTMVFTALGSDSVYIWGSKVTATDEEAVEYDASKLSVPKEVFTDFSIENQKGLYGSEFEWESSNEDVIRINGQTAEVTQPDEEKTVTLTVTVSKGSESIEKEFEVLVDAYDADIIRQIPESTTLSLPAKTAAGTAITWTSDHEDVINPATGVVTAPESGNVKVTLTATYGDISIDYIINVGEVSYIYEEDFDEATDTTGWISPNYQPGVTLEADGTNKWIQFASASQNSRGVYSDFGVNEDVGAIYSVEMDVKLTAGNNNETQFVISGTDLKYSNNVVNDGADSGYILKLKTTNDTVWTVNDDAEQKVTIAKDTWTHISVQVNQNTKKASVVITNKADGTKLYDHEVGVNGNGILKGVYVRDGKSYPVFCIDNIKVY